ncbi:hypothetical protein ARAM_000966 [Aspergillus rambellii]|uniref:A-kinase anchor protein 7-like phosphoesterase domain-containing protein n=1 Tax=Aspergillus rambellii TaxID=308745 RepID=A0A0F8V342_9EURO|nr:hypothetical protein ARAM_000966 [Aspergillus rambellii]
MSENFPSKTQTQNHNQKQRNPKKPPLTHFLCLPLVNDISLPQLESSLLTFESSIPPTPTAPHHHQPHPLIPQDAIRPVGTLHLTLGVMSLPTPERLNEALRFFNSLDLVALMRQAENTAQKKRLNAAKKRKLPESIKRETTTLTEGRNEGVAIAGKDNSSVSSDQLATTTTTTTSITGENPQDEFVYPTPSTPTPFTISLESLHALPRARFATVLHAAPVDPTFRLYPFCELLRDRFLEAGFLQGEYKKHPDNNKDPKSRKEQGSHRSDPEPEPVVAEEPSLLEEMPTEIAEEPARKSDSHVATTPTPTPTTIPNSTTATNPDSKQKTAPQLKPRPLLLHATVVNTIYIRGRKRAGGRGAHGEHHKGNSRRNSQYTFDARDILSHYRDFYLDRERVTSRSNMITPTLTHTETENENTILRRTGDEETSTTTSTTTSNDPALMRDEREMSPAAQSIPLESYEKETQPPYPFVWARDFPLETLCICEMGAKKLDLDADESGLNARLREKYMVVAQRGLDFGSSRGG